MFEALFLDFVDFKYWEYVKKTSKKNLHKYMEGGIIQHYVNLPI